MSSVNNLSYKIQSFRRAKDIEHLNFLLATQQVNYNELNAQSPICCFRLRVEGRYTTQVSWMYAKFLEHALKA